MKRYVNVGQLLLDIRTCQKKTQLAMAEWLEVNERTYRRWEKDKNQIADHHVNRIAEITSIPFEVLVRLNHGYPTLYNINTRRYSLCPFDKDYINKKILRLELFNTEEVGDITSLIHHPPFKRDKLIDFPIYPYRTRLNGDYLYYAAQLLPDLNIIITDPKGYYSGHIVTLPLAITTYELLKSGEISEYRLDRYTMPIIQPHTPIALHILSFFAINTTYVYCLTKRLVHFLLSSVPHKLSSTSILSRYVITNDGAEFCKKFGMNLCRYGFGDFKEYSTETTPHFFEIPIFKIKWLNFYREKVLGKK